MRNTNTQDTFKLGVGLTMLGGVLFALAVGSGFAAVSHMGGSVPVCGPVDQHCILCIAAAASLLASLGVIAGGVLLMRTPSSPQRAVQVIAPRR